MPDILCLSMEDHSIKTLVHALLCAQAGPCSRPDCTEEVAAMKGALQRMEVHTASCEVGSANVPGRRRRQQECRTCTNWRQLTKLRDRFAKQLLKASSQQKQRQAQTPRPLLRRQVTQVMRGAEQEGLDLALLPPLVESELQVQRRRREAKEGARSTASATGASRTESSSLASIQPPSRGADDDDKDPSSSGRRGSGRKRTREGEVTATDELAVSGFGVASSGAATSATEADERLMAMIKDGARLSYTPPGKGTAASRKWRRPPSAAATAGATASTAAADDDGAPPTEDPFPPSVGMHVALDTKRSKRAALPDVGDSIATAAPPSRSNLAVVSTAHPDGTCDCTIVCNECLPGVHEEKSAACDGAVPQGGTGVKSGGKSGSKGRAKGAVGSACSGRCGAGSVIAALHPPQRQIVCSGCLQANLPHALPMLRCCGCDLVLPAGSSYCRAAPVGDSHVDVVLCVPCHATLFDADDEDAARTRLLDELEDEAAKLRPADFALLTWAPEDEREYDDYVQCTHCDRWYHFVCASYPAVDQVCNLRTQGGLRMSPCNESTTSPQPARNQPATSPQPARNQPATSPQPARNQPATSPQRAPLLCA